MNEELTLQDLIPFLTWSTTAQSNQLNSFSLASSISQLILEYSPLEIYFQYNLSLPDRQEINQTFIGAFINPFTDTITTSWIYLHTRAIKCRPLPGPLVSIPGYSNPYSSLLSGDNPIHFPPPLNNRKKMRNKRGKKKAKEATKKSPFLRKSGIGDGVIINVPFEAKVSFFPKYLSNFRLSHVYEGSPIIQTNLDDGKGSKEIIYIRKNGILHVQTTIVDPKAVSWGLR